MVGNPNILGIATFQNSITGNPIQTHESSAIARAIPIAVNLSVIFLHKTQLQSFNPKSGYKKFDRFQFWLERDLPKTKKGSLPVGRWEY